MTMRILNKFSGVELWDSDQPSTQGDVTMLLHPVGDMPVLGVGAFHDVDEMRITTDGAPRVTTDGVPRVTTEG